MNSLADLPRLDRLVHLSCANVPTRREPAGLTLGRALALGASLIGISALVMLVFALFHEGWGSWPALRLQASHPETGERFRLTVQWEAHPAGIDPTRRCQQAAAYLGGEIARRMTVDSVSCVNQGETN